MATIPGDELSLAREAEVRDLTANSAVAAQLEMLHDLVVGVCPDCLIKKRNDDALIYVPPERREASRNKNLLTLWAEGTGVRMRIMPEPEEMYDASNREAYLKRLQHLRGKMRSQAGCESGARIERGASP